jgi:hypothetical protein
MQCHVAPVGQVQGCRIGRYRVVYRVGGRTVMLVTVFAGERDGWPDDLDPDAD